MLAKTRQEKIRGMLRTEGAVTTARLMQEFDVSIETVRRDLVVLEQAGVLRRVHGGALTVNEMMPYIPLESRNKTQNAQKDELCRKAVEFINEGDYISIGTGSTPIHFARILRQTFQRLTVVTYSYRVFEELRGVPGFQLVLVGGQFSPEEEAFSGPLTQEMYSNLYVQKAFVFPSAVSLEHGCGGYEQMLYPLQRLAMQHCDQAYILADSSKFERKALYKVDDMRPEYIYITDSQLPAELARLYAENGLNVITGDGA